MPIVTKLAHIIKKLVRNNNFGAPKWLSWVSIGLLILGGGHDPRILRWSPMWGSALSRDFA